MVVPEIDLSGPPEMDLSAPNVPHGMRTPPQMLQEILKMGGEAVQGVKDFPKNVMQSDLVKQPTKEIPAMLGQFFGGPMLDVPQMAYNTGADLFNRLTSPIPLSKDEPWPTERMPKMPQLMPPQTGSQSMARLLGDLFASKVGGSLTKMSQPAIAKTYGFLADLPEEMYATVLKKPRLMEKDAPAQVGEQLGRYAKLLHGGQGQKPVNNVPIITELERAIKQSEYNGQGPLTVEDAKTFLEISKKAQDIKTLEQAQGFKKDLQENYIKWGAKGDSANRIMEGLANYVNKEVISPLAPKLADLNSEYNFLMKYKNELEYLNTTKGKYPRNYKSMIAAGTIGGAAWLMEHSPPLGIGLAALMEGASTPLAQAQTIKYGPKLNELFSKTAPLGGAMNVLRGGQQ